MKAITHALVPAGFAILLGSCATANDFEPSPFEPEGPTWVAVQNNNWLDMDVFIVRYGQGRRLGMVTSMQTERFRIPRAWVRSAEQVAIRVEPIGQSGYFHSQEVPLEPGAVFDLTVQNQLAMSTMVIR